MSDPTSDEDFVFADDSIDAPPEARLKPWPVLVVDDDASVHSITSLVLGDVQFQGRGLELIAAFSGAEAAQILRKRHDIAVILLDVVMEREDAGLRLAREIREDIGNRAVRIILRTGEPGQAPERRVILDFDINDYKSKADLTSQQLFTATISALRSYADIVTLDESRRFLACLVQGAPRLFAEHDQDRFAQAALAQISDLIGPQHPSALLSQAPQDGQWHCLAGTLASETLASPAKAIAPFVGTMAQAITRPDLILRPIHTTRSQPACLIIQPSFPLSADTCDLLDIFCSTLGVGLDNISLHHALLAEQAELERRVAERTGELAQANAALRASQAVMDEELRAAGTLQQAILPATFPAHPRVAGAALMRPARAIGGDFYDVVVLDRDRIALVIADVSGKGPQAALFMMLVRTILQDVLAARAPGAAPSDLIAEINRRLVARNPLSLFVTMLFAIIDAGTGRLRFCSAGHGMPLIRRADGQVDRPALQPSLMLGLIENADFTTHDVPFGPQDTLVLCTDGVLEAENSQGEPFGADRLTLSCSSAAGPSAQSLLTTIIADVDRFARDTVPSDDITCLVAKLQH